LPGAKIEAQAVKIKVASKFLKFDKFGKFLFCPVCPLYLQSAATASLKKYEQPHHANQET
jgi:hypothetical protein